GGVIGCEYACMFAALGVRITLVDARDSLLAFLDGEMVEKLIASMRHMGIELRTGARWETVTRVGNNVVTHFEGGRDVVNEHLLYAAGREGRIEELNLEGVGVLPDKRGYLYVNDLYQTTVPNILGAGDAIGFPALAATSMEQGRVAVCHAFGFEYKKS